MCTVCYARNFFLESLGWNPPKSLEILYFLVFPGFSKVFASFSKVFCFSRFFQGFCRFFPITLCGVLVFDSVSRAPRSSAASCLPTTTNNSQQQLCHTSSVTTTLSHIIFHTHLCHTSSVTTTLSHMICHNHFVTDQMALGGALGPD